MRPLLLALLVVPSLASARKPDLLADVFLSQLDEPARAKLTNASDDALAAALDARHKTTARAALLSREADATRAQLETLADGYSMLGYPADAARVAAALQRGDPRNPDGYLLAAAAYRQSGDFARSAAEARKALELDPNDRRAQVLLSLTEGRSASLPSSVPSMHPVPTKKPGPSPASGVATNVPARPRPLDGEIPPDTAYLGKASRMDEQQHRPSIGQQALRSFQTRRDMLLHKPTPDEREAIAKAKAAMEVSAAGRELIQRLGGWDAITKNVNFTVGTMPTDTHEAYTHENVGYERLFIWKPISIVISRHLMEQPPQVFAPVLGHELSHYEDHMKYKKFDGLAMASEYGAHLEQIHIYEDIKKTLSPAEIKRLHDNLGSWRYQEFMAKLWEDKILERFSYDQFVNQYESNGGKEAAKHAYRDLQNKKTAPGTPQLRFHLYEDPVEGMYRGSEGDLPDMPWIHDPDQVRARQQMLDAQTEEDDKYRREHGFTIP